MEKISSIEQPLLKRSVQLYRVSYDGSTPKRTELVTQITGKAKGRVVITHIHTITGQQAAFVHCHVYSEPVLAESVERTNLLAKQQPKAEPAAAESA